MASRMLGRKEKIVLVCLLLNILNMFCAIYIAAHMHYRKYLLKRKRQVNKSYLRDYNLEGLMPTNDLECFDNLGMNRKRRKNVDDGFRVGFSNMVEAMTMTAQSVDRLVSCFCEPPPPLPVEPLRKVFEEVAKISGLNEDEVLEASQIIMGDPVKVNLLFCMPDKLKKKWVDKLLR